VNTRRLRQLHIISKQAQFSTSSQPPKKIPLFLYKLQYTFYDLIGKLRVVVSFKETSTIARELFTSFPTSYQTADMVSKALMIVSNEDVSALNEFEARVTGGRRDDWYAMIERVEYFQAYT
jgi:hypothetical protein